MIETEKLYYKDAYRKEFEAVVKDCREGKNGWEIVLDATAFYPEGGGQPWDTGCLGEAEVLEVREKDGEIRHIVNRPLTPGTAVKGTVNWARRFDFMQQHSGEHIVSGLIHDRFGYDNVGFHMGKDTVTIDFNGEINAEELEEIEKKANEVVWKNERIRIFYPSEEERSRLPYRSKKALTGSVRIVEFPGTDCCACCGLHVDFAGAIGMIKLLSVEKFREGVRVEMISGGRVLAFLNLVQAQNQRISSLLSAKTGETARAVERTLQENYSLKGRVIGLEEELFAAEARKQAGKGDVLLFEKELEADSVRKLAAAVIETCAGRCAVFSDNGDGSFKYALGEKDGDLRELVKEMNRALSGRGGGKPFFVQGMVRASQEEIRKFFEER